WRSACRRRPATTAGRGTAGDRHRAIHRRVDVALEVVLAGRRGGELVVDLRGATDDLAGEDRGAAGALVAVDREVVLIGVLVIEVDRDVAGTRERELLLIVLGRLRRDFQRSDRDRRSAVHRRMDVTLEI